MRWPCPSPGFTTTSGSWRKSGLSRWSRPEKVGARAVNVLIVPLLIDELKVSEAFFGLIEVGQVTGMVVAGSLVAVLAQRLRPSSLVSGGWVGLGMAIAGLSLIQAGWHMAVVGFFVGFLLAPVNGGVGTLSQTLVSDKLRGRVMERSTRSSPQPPLCRWIWLESAPRLSGSETCS